MNNESGIMQELLVKFFPIAKKYWLPLSLGFLGMTFFAYGLIWFFSGSYSASNDVVFQPASTTSQNSELPRTSIAVDIEGGVVRPGVYKLPLESRIQDVLILAGGLSESADRGWADKNLNLAARITDGGKIYIPRLGEGVRGDNGDTGISVTGVQININSASESELDNLVGVGSVTAGKIISARPYSSIDELLKKKIVSSKVFNQIKEKISVY